MRNPILYADYPDLDVIRVGEAYYMVSTTMHMFPGCDLLRSYDLVRWELCCHVYDTLDSTPAQRLTGGKIYGQGMWAASLRYHAGLYHIVFVCNDTHRSYHYTTQNPEGPWTRQSMAQGFYHDSSVLFDDDGRVYIAYGNREIRIKELTSDLSAEKPGGLDRVAVVDTIEGGLGFEGTHFYKLGGKYYLFFIHWPRGGMRTQSCFVSDTPGGVFTGGDILADDMGFHGMGVAQGGIVDTPDGRWYSLLFQDRGAVGRVPVLVPMRWEKGFPVLDKVPQELDIQPDARPMRPLVASDTLRGEMLSDCWQWNHEPDNALWRLTGAGLRLTAGTVTTELELARNTLTQRTTGERCAFEVTVDAKGLTEGDRAGLCALQGCFAALAVTKERGAYQLVLQTRRDGESTTDKAAAPLDGAVCRLRAEFDFTDLRDTVQFFYQKGGAFTPIGGGHQLHYKLDHFMGCRAGLFCYAQKQAGGSALFSDFVYCNA